MRDWAGPFVVGGRDDQPSPSLGVRDDAAVTLAASRSYRLHRAWVAKSSCRLVALGRLRARPPPPRRLRPGPDGLSRSRSHELPRARPWVRPGVEQPEQGAVVDDGAQEVPSAPGRRSWPGPCGQRGVMLSRPTNIGVRDATAVTQGIERQSRAPWSHMPRPRLWHGQGIEPERAVARQCALGRCCPGLPVRRYAPMAGSPRPGLLLGSTSEAGFGAAIVRDSGNRSPSMSMGAGPHGFPVPALRSRLAQGGLPEK
jgi:hypothetical protein